VPPVTDMLPLTASGPPQRNQRSEVSLQHHMIPSPEVSGQTGIAGTLHLRGLYLCLNKGCHTHTHTHTHTHSLFHTYCDGNEQGVNETSRRIPDESPHTHTHTHTHPVWWFQEKLLRRHTERETLRVEDAVEVVTLESVAGPLPREPIGDERVCVV